MKQHPRIFVLGLLSTCIVIVAGCAAPGGGLVRDESVAIEAVSSRDAHVVNVRLYRDDAGMLMRGELRNRSGGRAAIQGHVDIEVIRPDGTHLSIHNVSYRRWSARSRAAHFTYRLKPVPQNGSIVRVVHHSAATHTAIERSRG